MLPPELWLTVLAGLNSKQQYTQTFWGVIDLDATH